ncbi:MAG: hypothetical protein WDM88_09830 [Galbitalea sp.]
MVRRTELTALDVPHDDATGWRGPASSAYGHALAELRREALAGTELLRAAAGLTAEALVEVDGRA